MFINPSTSDNSLYFGTKLVNALLIFVLLVIQPLSVQTSFAFGTGFTTSAANRAERRINKCRAVPGDEKNGCVGKALDKLAANLSSKPDYAQAVKIIRKAAAKVKVAKSTKKAVAAVVLAKKQLLRSRGIVLTQHTILADVMGTARSVLRS